MAVEFCPRCGNPRTGSFRFCRACQFDFDSVPQADPPIPPAAAPNAVPPFAPTSTARNDADLILAAGVSWIVCAAFTGYLALEQLNAGNTLSRFGIDSGNYTASAAWNGIAAVVTIYFAARLLRRNSTNLVASMIWAAISVVSGGYQVANGVNDAAFLFSIVAAGAAGVLSLAAWTTLRKTGVT
jgi:hypothetical protein